MLYKMPMFSAFCLFNFILTMINTKTQEEKIKKTKITEIDIDDIIKKIENETTTIINFKYRKSFLFWKKEYKCNLFFTNDYTLHTVLIFYSKYFKGKKEGDKDFVSANEFIDDLFLIIQSEKRNKWFKKKYLYDYNDVIYKQSELVSIAFFVVKDLLGKKKTQWGVGSLYCKSKEALLLEKLSDTILQ